MFKSIVYFLFSFIGLIHGQCVDINNKAAELVLNTTFNKKCYDHTLQEQDCCKNFVFNTNCIDTYKECDTYSKYVLNNIKSHCHQNDRDMFNLTYSDKCHNFTLYLEPYCCENMYLDDCSNWYTQCHIHSNQTTNCNIPTKYTNTYCDEYTKHIDNSCCDNFDDTCDEIYYWCLNNHPNQTDIMDLFIGPIQGHTISQSNMVHNDIKYYKNCAKLCLDTGTCMSFNFISSFRLCVLNKHMKSDPGIVFINNTKYNSVYYEKIFDMPIHDTNCNVKSAKWIGDGVCDTTGGYNTKECHYDKGDCCEETCKNNNAKLQCGLLGFDCKDPFVLNPPTLSPTPTPTPLPTQSPTIKPTLIPTQEPTQEPTQSPTQSPTIKPTLIPTEEPTQTPTKLIVYASNSKNNSEDHTVVTILIVIICLLFITMMFMCYKFNYNTSTFKVNKVTNGNAMHFSNPVYDQYYSREKASSTGSDIVTDTGSDTVSFTETVYQEETDNEMYHDPEIEDIDIVDKLRI